MSRYCPNPDCRGLRRDGIVAEFNDGVRECVDCATPLVPGEARPEPDPALEYNALRTIFIAESGVQAHLVASTLEAEGIPVYLKGEMLQGAVGELSADVHQVEVQVPMERFERGREIALRFEGPYVASPYDPDV